MNRTPVSVAIAVVQDSNGRILVGIRPDGVPLAGLAEFPGGKIESGESPESAAVRECREETGLNVAISSLPTTVHHEYDHASLRLLFFHCSPTDITGIPRSPYRYVTLEELAQLKFPAANQTIIDELLLPWSSQTA